MSENKPNFREKMLAIIKRLRIGQAIYWVVTIALAVLVFIFMRDFVASWRLTALPGMAVTRDTGAQGTAEAGGATPTPEVVAPEDQLPPPWDGGSRVNILFIGLDYGDWSADRLGASRSDTMILLTIDPLSKTAGMLSIPRDLWVNIPGHGYGKINTAYYIGDAFALPGGGPELAIRTVEQVIGVPVQYYVRIDFYTFIDIVDELGGIDVQVEDRLVLDPIGPGMDKVILTPGLRHLNGWKALAYARIRKQTQGGDVDRARRQQQVIMALRDKVFSAENFPTLAARAPAMYEYFSYGIHTNMAFNDAMQLAVLAQQIPVGSIKQGVINYEMVTLGNSPDGLNIFKPIPDKIRVLRDEIFTTGGALSPLAQGDPLALMQAEAPRVKIFNGASGVAGLSDRTAQYLASQGMTVVGLGDAEKAYTRTILLVHSGKLYTLRYLIDLFRVDSNASLVIQYDPNADADIEINLGSDWANSNPMP